MKPDAHSGHVFIGDELVTVDSLLLEVVFEDVLEFVPDVDDSLVLLFG